MSEANLFTVVPVYNGGKTIGSVISKLSEYVPLNHIIIVDDGSTDETRKELNKFENLIYIKHEMNRGKGAALKTGIAYALKQQPEYICTLDADGQHEPAEIPNFLNAINTTNSDIILGSRMKNLSEMPFHRVLSNKLTSYLISNKIKQKIRDSQTGFRLFKAKIFHDLTLNSNHFDFETEVLLKAGRKGYKIGHVNIATIYPQNGVSAIKIIDVFRFAKVYFNL